MSVDLGLKSRKRPLQELWSSENSIFQTHSPWNAHSLGMKFQFHQNLNHLKILDSSSPKEKKMMKKRKNLYTYHLMIKWI